MSFSNSSIVEQFTAERNYEDEAVRWDSNIRYAHQRLSLIYKEWGYEVAARFNKEGRPVHEVCSHIKNRLRVRGCSEGTIDYVAQCLPAIMKDSRYDHSDKINYNRDRNLSQNQVYEDLDEVAGSLHYRYQVDTMSDATRQEVLPRSIDLKKAKIKQLREEVAMEKQECFDYDIKIPETDKVSARIPQERFHGQTELYHTAQGMREEAQKLADQWDDLAERIYFFKPTEEWAATCSQKLQQYKDTGFYRLRFINMLMYKGAEDILTPATDLKWCNLLSGWFQMGKDRLEKYGNKGCGTKHAIPTGQFVLKKYKDGHVELIGLKREYTREQVHDKSQKQLIKLALEIVLANKAEQAIADWMNNTIIVEKVME